jgi:3-dehydroquinate dehydratase
MAGTNVADASVEYLSSRGVENIFGVRAHTSFAIGDAIASFGLRATELPLSHNRVRERIRRRK